MRRFIATALGLLGAVAMLVAMLAQRYVAEIDDGADVELGAWWWLGGLALGLAGLVYVFVRLG